MDENDPFRLVVLDLAEQTLKSCDNPFQFMNDYPKLREEWGVMLHACRTPGGSKVDWVEVRKLLLDCLPREVLTDAKFEAFMWSTLIDHLGTLEGVKGASIVFARQI